MHATSTDMISIIMPCLSKAPYDQAAVIEMCAALALQEEPCELILLADDPQLATSLPEEVTAKLSLQFQQIDTTTAGAIFEQGYQLAKGEYLLYLDTLRARVQLKKAALAAFKMAARRNPQAGMVYADYELVTGTQVAEVHLLDHHPGRLRDNQDYGYAFFCPRRVIKQVGSAKPQRHTHYFYELRLKLGRVSPLVHIGNKIAGSLYQVYSTPRAEDVFDYLLSSQASQQEAEAILTEHLQALGAYLAPDENYRPRPAGQPCPPLQASIVIPVFQRPQFIHEALGSVQRQTVKDVEVIVVVNGGSDDPTAESVRQYLPGGPRYQPDLPQVRLLVTDINNIGFCLNLGIAAARSNYYIQLDSDDRLKPNAVARILELFAQDPQIGMVIGSYEVWEKREDSGAIVRCGKIPVVQHREWTAENGRNNLLRINGAGAPRAIPIAVIEEMGGFGINDEPYARNYGEDYHMVLKISEHYKIGRIWEPIYEVIRHSGGTDHSIDQVTIVRNDEAKDWMRLAALKRRLRLHHQSLPDFL